MMRSFEKLIILLEMHGVDVSNFKQLKKNELLLMGSKEITEDISYRDLVKHQNHLVIPENGYNNPFFAGLGIKKQPESIENILIQNYHNKKYETILDIMNNENLVHSQKEDVVYRGIQQLSNEYKNVLENISAKDLLITNAHLKLTKNNANVIEPNWLKKRNILFWLCGILLLVFDLYYINGVHILKHPAYVILYNIVFNVLILFPFIKITYYLYLKRESGQKALLILKKKYDELIASNDSQIERLETDLYRYYNKPSKGIPINYFKKTNLEFKNVRNTMNQLMNTNTNQTFKKMIRLVIKLTHWVALIGFIILIISYFFI